MQKFILFLLLLCTFVNAEWGQKDVHRLLLKRTNQKDGVYTAKLEPVMDTAGLVVVAEYHKAMGDSYRPTITSANDFSWHGRFSKHYLNLALDFRIRDVPFHKRSELVLAIKKALGERFLVLWEDAGTLNEHLHIEFRPSE
ncbi:MAG: hypothetical protein J6Z31_02620 [Fibrobacter sp.]|nr:hypothetical protein [Fibrobacter sp.]